MIRSPWDGLILFAIPCVLLSHSMLSGTHFLFTINTSPHFYSLPRLLSSPSYLQGMESVPGDLRSGFGPEVEGKTVADNEFSGLNGAAASRDDFFVDELLDFSNGYSETEEQMDEPQEMVMVGAKTRPLFQEKQEVAPTDNSVISGKEDFGSLHDGELSVQAESLESLEWLSHFVEDSISDYSLAGISPPHATEDKPETTSTVKEQSCFATPVQTKARTKRTRVGVRVWPVLWPSFTDSTTSSSSSTSSTTSIPLSYMGQSDDSFLGSAPAKKQIRKPADRGGDGSAQPRRCSHCGVTRTPQWRAGPLGSKTLCNACGVRYKSGRLLPEYRPACSPTFSSELHSNNHRKVLEMRRQKVLETDATSLPPPPVQNF